MSGSEFTLRSTQAGRKILRMLYDKYGTDNPEVLLECVVLEQFAEIFPGYPGGAEIRRGAKDPMTNYTQTLSKKFTEQVEARQERRSGDSYG